MEQFAAIGIFLFVLFLLLGTGVWVGLALLGVAWVGMELFTLRPAGDAMRLPSRAHDAAATGPRRPSVPGRVMR